MDTTLGVDDPEVSAPQTHTINMLAGMAFAAEIEAAMRHLRENQAGRFERVVMLLGEYVGKD